MTEARPVRIPECHPDRPHCGKGMCASCYQMDYRRKRAEADPEYMARAAEYGKRYRRANGRLAQRKYRERNRDELRRKGRERAQQLRADPSYRARQAEVAQRYWRLLKAEMIAAYGGKCSCCGENQPAFLTLEHLNGDGKAHRAKVGNSNVWADLKQSGWPKDGYTVLCFNCNLGKRVNGGTCPHEQTSTVPASNKPLAGANHHEGNKPPSGEAYPWKP